MIEVPRRKSIATLPKLFRSIDTAPALELSLEVYLEPPVEIPLEGQSRSYVETHFHLQFGILRHSALQAALHLLLRLREVSAGGFGVDGCSLVRGD